MRYICVLTYFKDVFWAVFRYGERLFLMKKQTKYMNIAPPIAH